MAAVLRELELAEQQEINFNVLMSVRYNIKELVNRKCNEDFLSFVKRFAPFLVSDFVMGKHIELIAEKLQKVESCEIKRLMVFLPPRSSKSVICYKLFPAWYIGKHANHEIMSISHSDQLASDFGR